MYMVLQSAQFIYESKHCLHKPPILIEGQSCAFSLQLSYTKKKYEILMFEYDKIW